MTHWQAEHRDCQGHAMARGQPESVRPWRARMTDPAVGPGAAAAAPGPASQAAAFKFVRLGARARTTGPRSACQAVGIRLQA